jgi:F420-dependent oxidoreductase-like protein
MKLGLMAGFPLAKLYPDEEQVLLAESLGFDSAWAAEAYGNDAVSPAAWMLARTTRIKVGTAIMQMHARTPACAATTAITLNELSGGRFILGLGPSGPGVVEGWHGVPYGKPLTRLREYIDIIRLIEAREEPLTYAGEYFQLPYVAEGATGLGLPLKGTLKSQHPIKIFTAAITPNGVRNAAQVANGFFPVWMSPERADLFADSIAAGLQKSAGNRAEKFETAPIVQVSMGDNLDKCRANVKGWLALYIGGMGPRKKNFYNRYAIRMGYPDEAKQIQDLYLDGKQREAAALVPNKLVDEIALVGPATRIKERLEVWKAAGQRGEVDTMMLAGASPEAMELIAAEMLI